MYSTKRNTDLNEIFFNLKINKLFTKNEIDDEFKLINGKKVIINSNNNHPISIVSDGYEIISNKEAFDYGQQCIRILFNLDDNHKLEVFNIIRPNTLSFCHIDIICPQKAFKLREDSFIPFVRVTNSYNKLFKLYFRVGICRSICENGMIFGEDSIKFSFNHNKGSKEKINFDIKKDDFNKILNKFKSDIEILSNNIFDLTYLIPMVYSGMGLNPKYKVQKAEEIDFMFKLDTKILELSKIYKSELGNNFYSVYNIITDICTRGIEGESLLVSKIHNRQTRAGRWLLIVADHLRKYNFEYENYLLEYLNFRKN